MRRLPTLVLVAAFIAGMAAQMDAYVRLSGAPRWAASKVTMQMQLVATKPALIDGSASWNAAATPGLSAWNAKIRNLQFAVVQNSTASKEFPNSYRGNLRSSSNPGYDIRRVAIHEFGHALGLSHSTASTAIMRPIISNQDKLGADDIAGAQKIYGVR